MGVNWNYAITNCDTFIAWLSIAPMQWLDLKVVKVVGSLCNFYGAFSIFKYYELYVVVGF